MQQHCVLLINFGHVFLYFCDYFFFLGGLQQPQEDFDEQMGFCVHAGRGTGKMNYIVKDIE